MKQALNTMTVIALAVPAYAQVKWGTCRAYSDR